MGLLDNFLEYETTTMEVYKWIYVLFKMYSELL